ncbi:MAG TPA: sodium/solute symporter [Acidobacteriaceae bacterium]|nr:sodium/solute symporter [Acidobacteriaceae bacterium]
MAISPIDAIVIAVYLVGITAFGIKAGYRRDASSQQYFLANRSLGWFTVGAAVFTSNISTLHLVGYAAGGARDGLVIGNFEWMACFILILLALMFAPFYIRSGVATLPEFMERRYCPSARTFLAVIGILGALLIHIGISLFAAAKVFEGLLGVPMFATIAVLSLFTVTYSALGGLKAVVMTESIQVVLLLAGATLITILGMRALPGVGVRSLSDLQRAVAPGQLHMLQPVMNREGHLNEFSWLAVLLGYPILGIWYWCADQTHVQRVLGAHSLKEGQNGALFAGFLKLLPVFLMVFPGVIGYVLWQRGVLHLGNVAGTNRPDYNTMLPLLIAYLIPVGVRGLIAASLAAALMSCMAAALNSCATLISIDVVKRMHPQATDARVVRAGRITTGVIMVLAMLWSTQGDQFGTIFEAVNKIPMTFAPAVTTVFVLGVLWKRGTKQAAMATLYFGTLIGVIYFLVDLPVMGRWILPPSRLTDFGGFVTDPVQGLGIPFMLAGPIIAVFCVIIYVAISLVTPAMDEAEVAKVCWDHPLAFLKGPITAMSDPRIISLLLLVTVGVCYYALR